MSVSLPLINQTNVKLTCLERIRDRIYASPTLIKVLKVAGFSFGSSLLMISFFYRSNLGFFTKTCFGLEGTILIAAALKVETILIKILPKSLPKQRRYPPLARCDTCIFTRDAQGNVIPKESVHGTGNCFKDAEIVIHHPVIRKVVLPRENPGKEVYAEFVRDDNKAIIQQQATRGCTAAVAAMLIKDQGGDVDIASLEERNLGTNEDIKEYIRTAGFEPIDFGNSRDLQELRKNLLKNGSGIVSITDPEIGGHVIVVDEVSADLQRVRLRDPYHGWKITVTSEAFLSRFPINLIQIEKKG